MELPPGLNPVMERRVKRATGLRCELCGGAYPADILEIHLIPQASGRSSPGPDLQREILVLCPRCHREVRTFRPTRADQKALVRCRQAAVRGEMRAILGYAPRPYTPPDADLAAVYEEIREIPCLNGSG